MNLDTYNLGSKPGFLSFEFTSEGPKGKIRKIIQFNKIIGQNNTYNLGFGDSDEEGNMDDLVVSNNKDSQKILVTVATSVIIFTDNYPNALVLAQGSTPSRIRYYTMGISKHLQAIAGKFEIWGALSENEWELFRKNRPYKALLAKRK